jgi:hypothetical protein
MYIFLASHALIAAMKYMEPKQIRTVLISNIGPAWLLLPLPVEASYRALKRPQVPVCRELTV